MRVILQELCLADVLVRGLDNDEQCGDAAENDMCAAIGTFFRKAKLIAPSVVLVPDIDLMKACTSAADANLASHLASLSISDVPSLSWADFEVALPLTSLAGRMDVDSGGASSLWDTVGGYEDVKRRLVRTALWPLLRPETWTRLGVRPPGGVLLYGPSGCGKTALLRALAGEPGIHCVFVKA
ncbi:MAG: P-loop containing nucleoside triphosphate hydrolase protein [Olpidium bornovanus]|uniref:P-loop containing nucleoside triphosphate hydrolase protein n=1 Tax=Olpidium bornovanus TaxID=278681 RepID=A0A8H7ZMK3_9FUNG|nr:MAG: P-loop containing nucleoside triphosphate hydrolase protein [Olpidium bornovanus]